jgi:signal transduction histidine kinase
VEVLVAAPAYLPPLPAAVEVAAYRIVVEAVTDVVRHSGADRCAISVTPESALVLTVTDDGHGLRRSADSGHGLAIMRERAEELGGEVLASNVGSGVRVEARLPLGVVNHGARRERARS